MILGPDEFAIGTLAIRSTSMHIQETQKAMEAVSNAQQGKQ